jgi:hypothetical protein
LHLFAGTRREKRARKIFQTNSNMSKRARESSSTSIDEDEPNAKKQTLETTTTTTVSSKLSELLDACTEGNPTQASQFVPHFEKIAQFLSQQVVIQLGTDTLVRIAELEFYYTTNGKEHKDPFSHQHPYQLNRSSWYFHRSTAKLDSNYKGGSYKGLDISIGDKTRKIHAGVLIRSFVKLEKKKLETLEGPCKCVDFILKKNGVDSIDSLVTKKMKNKLSIEENRDVLCVRLKSDLTEDEQKALFPSNKYNVLYSGPRVGLTLKKTDHIADRRIFIMKPYRYYTAPSEMKKGKNLMIASQFYKDYFADGTEQVQQEEEEKDAETDTEGSEDDEEEAKVTKSPLTDKKRSEYNKIFGTTTASITSYCNDFMKGRKLSKTTKFEGKTLSTSLLCELAGCVGVC